MDSEIVTAVPGSGKTYTLINRCYDLMVNEGVENVVAITFTDRAASELMDRLKKMARERNNLELLKKLPTSKVGTIHSFCSDILRDYGDLVKISRNFRVMDDIESYYFMEKTIREFIISVQGSRKGTEVSRTLDFIIDYFNTDIEEIIRYIRDIMKDNRSYFTKMHLLKGSFFTSYDRKNFTNEVMKEITTKWFVSIIPYLTAIMDSLILQYQDTKKETGMMDFDDLLVYTLEISKRVGPELAKRFPFILIDEFQDTDEVQIAIFENFLNNGSYIFAVGDPFQSIYSFRGAHPEAQEHLKNKVSLKNRLNENRRSFTNLINFYNSIFPQILSSETMDTKQQENGFVGISIDDDQFLSVSEIIKSRLRNGAKPGDIAILSRTGTQFLKLKKYLKDEGIDAVTVSGESILKSQEGLDIYNLIRYLADPSDRIAIAGILFSPFFNYDVSSLYRNKDELVKIVNQTFLKYREMLAYNRPDYVLKKMLINEGYISSISRLNDFRERNDRLWRIMVIVSSQIERYGDDIYSLEKWYSNAMETKENGPLDDLLSDTSRVKIMTIHQAKGLEFRIVIVFGFDLGVDNSTYVADDVTGPIRRSKDYGFLISPSRKLLDKGISRRHSKEEELRVMYVALTRAKEELYLVLSKGTGHFSRSPEKNTKPSQILEKVLGILDDDKDDSVREKLEKHHAFLVKNEKTPPLKMTSHVGVESVLINPIDHSEILNDSEINSVAIREFILSKNDTIQRFRVAEKGALITISENGLIIYERLRVQGAYYAENGKIEYVM